MKKPNAIRNTILNWFSSGVGGTDPDQPDLFEWANPDTEPEKKKRLIPVFIPLIGGAVIGIAIACFLCGNHSEATISKEGEVIRKDGTRVTGVIETMGDGRLQLKPNDPDEPVIQLDLNQVERIVFVEKEDKNGDESDLEKAGNESKATIRELTMDEKRFLGKYRIQVSGHTGDLILYKTRTGYLGGAIRFQTWGNRQLEYLKGIYVRKNRIYFIRSCAGAECGRIGAGSPFRQVYTGDMSLDGRKIEGNYKGGQNASRWDAVRK